MNTRILVAIGSYGTGNDQYLTELISRYRAMPYLVDIVVLSNIPRQLESGVEVLVGSARNPWFVQFGHKELFAKRVDRYDLFIYSEDDTPLSQRNIEAFLRATDILPEDEIAGFMRSETAPDGTLYFCDVFGHFRWEVGSVARRAGETFAFFSNEHSACYILTQMQLRKAIASGGFLVAPHDGKYDIKVTAATDPYTQCGFRRMISLSRLEDFIVPHLPNKYVGIYGVDARTFYGQIAALLSTSNENRKIRPLFQAETKLRGMKFSKGFFDPAGEDVAKWISPEVKDVLSVGCAEGRTEVWLAKRGFKVSAVPMDPVISAGLKSHGVEIIPSDIQEARRSLQGRTFDCVLFLDFLHLVPNPTDFLIPFSELLSEIGTAITFVPHVSRIGILRKKAFGSFTIRELGDYSKTGVSLTSPRIIRNWYHRCGLKVERILDIPSPRGLERRPLGLGQLLAIGYLVIGRQIRSKVGAAMPKSG